jgi:hypothetical protein
VEPVGCDDVARGACGIASVCEPVVQLDVRPLATDHASMSTPVIAAMVLLIH